MLIAAESASEYVSHHISDHPWPGCQVQVAGVTFTWMSDAIATMLLAGLILTVVLPLLARRRRRIPTGGYNALEVLVAFIRDWVARPALHARADAFLPFLLTLLFFILGMNLIGLVPTQSLAVLVNDGLGLRGSAQYTLGASPTGVLAVCGGLASLTLLNILARGLWRAARQTHERRGWPLAVCVVLSPVLWFLSLSPEMEGVAGAILLVPLAILELAGTLAKCFALMIRLFANLMAGHGLIAVMMLFVFQTSAGIVAAWSAKLQAVGIGAVCVAAGVLLDLLEMLVAVVQAYIFTYLSAIFLSLYGEGHHGG
jgi:F-type H+-transporting ATPase subunit a